MRGFPKHIATKRDVEVCQGLYPEETADYLQRLAEARFIWQDAGPVGDKEVVKESADLKVVENKTEAGVIERRKQIRVEDPGAYFFKLGVAVAEVERVLADVEKLDPVPGT